VNLVDKKEEEKNYVKVKRELLIQRVKEESLVSLDKLRNHINFNHSRNKYDKLSASNFNAAHVISTDPENLPGFIQDIGLGPSMYLLFQKVMYKLFMVLILINLPLCYLYFSGSESIKGTGDNVSLFDLLFGQFSMGNLGEQSIKCVT